MIPDGDPGSLPPFRPRVIFNGRLTAGGIKGRGGQTQFGAMLHDVNAAVRYLDDFQIGTKKSLITIGVGCPTFSPTAGFYIGSYDFEQSPEIQSNVYYSTTSAGLFAATYGDDLYIASDTMLRKYSAIESQYGVNGLSMAGLTQDIPLYELAAGFTAITFMLEFDGYLFLACDGGGSSKVVMWDGRTGYDDITGLAAAPLGMGTWRESLILGYNGSPNHIRVRPVGAPETAWATVAPGAGTVRLKNGISYRDVFYMTTGAEDIYKYDGSALTRIPVGTTGIAAGSVTDGIAVMGGMLYIAYTTSTNVARIAKYNGATDTWTAVEKDLTAQFGVATNSIGPMREYKGNLAVGGFTSLIGGELFLSPLGTAVGTWVRKTPPTQGGTLGGTLTRLVVY